MFCKGKVATVLTALSASQLAQAIYLDATNEQSIRDVSAQIAGDLMKNYYINANIQGIGQLPRPYYWWEAGGMFGSMVSYYAYTGDWSLNDIVGKAILSQASPTVDFMMPDQKYDLGNDDQVVWALTAMEAAEHNYPVPSDLKGQYSSDVWYNLANNAFNDIYKRWDTSTCNGGIRWQIYSSNSGYTYKSAISNAGLFQLAARLGRYTGDSDGSYQAAAQKIYNWMSGVGLLINDGTLGKMVFDGATTTTNCSTVDQHRWTYTAGSMLLGAQTLSSLGGTNAGQWGSIATSFLQGIQNTFLNYKSKPDVMFELNCEPYGTCNTDELAFKALMMRWFAKTTQVSKADYTNALMMSYVQSSAQAAANACSGGSSKTMCGTKWISNGWDGTQGVGQQMSALEAVQGLLVSKASLAKKGSSSKRDEQLASAKFSRRGLTARDYMEMSDAQRIKLTK